jgi:predicted ribosome quality control (RQC) complex YloA/Tae2 family protein
MKTFLFENFECKLGENAIENWQLLDEAEGNHVFFHLSSFPSGYVILQTLNPTPVMLYTAARICKDGTKYRDVPNIKVDYCLCSNLRKGEKPGLVYFRSQRKVQQIKL